VWRLAIEARHPVRAALFGVCVLVLAAVSRTEPADECRFERTWYAGDVHFNEQIEFRPDSTGTWIEDGMDSDAPHDRKDFSWQRTASTLTVAYDRDERRTVDYRLERRGNHCYLTFTVHPFLGEGSGFRIFGEYP
jgi:hypothetical protein